MALPTPNDLAAAAIGLTTGSFAAWAYYDELLGPLAHTFGLWITAVTVVAAGRSAPRAVIASCLCLAAAVVAFFVGLKVKYGVEYPGGSYPLNTGRILLWLLLAGGAGTVLGLGLRWAGRSGFRGRMGTAASVGLLVADAYRRSHNYPEDAPVVMTAAAMAIVLVVALTVRSWRQLVEVVLWTVPAALIGLALVATPDRIEQWLITGSF